MHTKHVKENWARLRIDGRMQETEICIFSAHVSSIHVRFLNFSPFSRSRVCVCVYQIRSTIKYFRSEASPVAADVVHIDDMHRQLINKQQNERWTCTSSNRRNSFSRHFSAMELSRTYYVLPKKKLGEGEAKLLQWKAVSTCVVGSTALRTAIGIGFRSNWCFVSWKLKQQVVALVVCWHCRKLNTSGWEMEKKRKLNQKKLDSYVMREVLQRVSFTNNCRLCQSAIGWFPSSRYRKHTTHAERCGCFCMKNRRAQRSFAVCKIFIIII